MMIRCRCGHQDAARSFEVDGPTAEQRKRFAYQAGREMVIVPRWKCRSCGVIWEVITGSDRTASIRIVRDARKEAA